MRINPRPQTRTDYGTIQVTYEGDDPSCPVPGAMLELEVCYRHDWDYYYMPNSPTDPASVNVTFMSARCLEVTTEAETWTPTPEHAEIIGQWYFDLLDSGNSREGERLTEKILEKER